MAGATGAMTGFAYPEILVRIVSAVSRRAGGRSGRRFYRAVPLMRFEFQEGIGMAIRKEVLHRRGALTQRRDPGARRRARRDDARGARSRAEMDVRRRSSLSRGQAAIRPRLRAEDIMDLGSEGQGRDGRGREQGARLRGRAGAGRRRRAIVSISSRDEAAIKAAAARIERETGATRPRHGG